LWLWFTLLPYTTRFRSLPFGFRRDLTAYILDSRQGRIAAILNALDLENLDPTIREPPIAQKSYYLRYRVSDDKGKTWKFDEPIIDRKSTRLNSSHVKIS